MDPTNPRWEHSEQRRQRSATFWKVMVGAAAGAALSTVIVASCLDRGEARRDRDRDLQEPGIVETTALTTPTAYAPGSDPAAAPAAPAAVGPSTSDSTGGVQAANTATAAPAAAPAAPAAAPVVVNNNTTVTSGEVERAPQAFTPAQNASTVNGASANGANGAVAGGQAGAADAGAGTSASEAGQASGARDAGVTRDARGNVIDPNNPGSNPQAPPMSAGAGRFNTESPYWSASSFPTNPEAGAGPFTTERNSPAYGLWGAYGQ